MSDSPHDYGIPGWLFGSLLTVVSAFSSTCGNMCMKKAQMVEDDKTRRGIKSKRYGSIPLCNLWWVAGFFTLAIAPTPLDMLALSTAGESVVYPLGAGLTIVFSQLLAPCFLGEKLTRIDWIATGLIVMGGTLTIIFGTHEDKRYSIDDLLDFWGNPSFLAWFFCSWGVACVVMGLWKFKRNAILILGSGMTIIALGFTAAVWAATQGIVLKNTSQILRYQAFHNGTDSEGEPVKSPFLRFETYLFILAVPLVGVFQLVYMNYGLQYFNATKFIPVYNTQVVIVASITGALYYNELHTLNKVAFPIGILIVCSGILILLFKQPMDTKEGHQLLGADSSSNVNLDPLITVDESFDIERLTSDSNLLAHDSFMFEMADTPTSAGDNNNAEGGESMMDVAAQ